MSSEGDLQNASNTLGSETAPKIRGIEHEKEQVLGNNKQNADLLSLSAPEVTIFQDSRNPDMERDKLSSGRIEVPEAAPDQEEGRSGKSNTLPQDLKTSAMATELKAQEGPLQDTDAGNLHSVGATSQDYLDPTPKTPRQGASPSREPHEEPKDGNPDAEIQSIMDQFRGIDDAVEEDNHWTATETQLSVPTLQHPPRRSSLIPVEAAEPQFKSEEGSKEASIGRRSVPVNEAVLPSRHSSLPEGARISLAQDSTPLSPSISLSLPTSPPSAPDPESDLPFDFHRFLEQLRDKSADPVAKYLRSFLIEFGRKQWMVHEQVKLVNDFLTFITNKMGRCAVWRDVSDAEFDNAKEGMEKLVMNRLYTQTFSPAIPSPTPAPTPKGRRRPNEKNIEPGRRGQHQEDIERDEILGQKIRIYGWVQEDHLDIPRVGDNGRRFLLLAQQELLKIKSYRAPRDKVICVLNCCKVIFGILRNSRSSDTSADSFVPLLIYVVLHANPDHLVSNVQYILRFRNQEKLGGEAGYYLSSLMGAIQFIENLDRTNLTVSDQEFETNVEAAVSIIAEKHQDNALSTSPQKRQTNKGPTASHLSEKSGPSMPEVIPRNSVDAEYSSPRKTPSTRGRPGEIGGKGEGDDNTAVGGLLRTIQKPLTSIGRMFTDDSVSGPASSQTKQLPGLPSPTRLSPALFQPPRRSEDAEALEETPSFRSTDQEPRDQIHKSDLTGERIGKLSAEDAASRQASAEAAEAHRIQQAEHQNVVETLAGMFPDLDRDVIDDVVRQKQGRVGLAVDACLALNN